MKKGEAVKLIKKYIKEAKSCPFCGKTPEINYRVDPKHSEGGSLGHFVKRMRCCVVTEMGQVELFFCNNHKPADYNLWQKMAHRLVEDWNTRI